MSNYIPNPLAQCASPTPCPDPCATQAYILGRQTQPIDCLVSPYLTDLLSYWDMDESGVGDVRADSHSTRHLTPSSASIVPGIISNAVHLSGSPGGYLQNSSSVFGFTSAYTIAGWINYRGVISGNGAYLVGKQNRTFSDGLGFPSEGWMLYITGSGEPALWHGNGSSTVEVTEPAGFDSQTWTFFVAGSTGTDQFIQINNGTRRTAAALTPTVGGQPFKFGELKGAGHASQLSGPNAYFDEFGVWNRVLTLEEATYLYNSGAGRTYPFS